MPNSPGHLARPAAVRAGVRAASFSVTLDVEVAMGESDARQAELTLTREEAQLLQLLGQGLPLGSVAQRLQTSQRTVRRRVKGVCDRLGVSSSIQAVVWAAQRGLI